MSLVRGLCWLVLLAPILVNSDSPGILPQTTYDFRFTGYVLASDGQPLPDYAVVALRDSSSLASGWGLLQPNCGFARSFVTLSDARGRFQLDISICRAPDSLAVGVLTPDTLIIGTRLYRRAMAYWRQEGEYPVGEKGFLCHETVTRTMLEAYVYDQVDSIMIDVPDRFSLR